MPLTAPRRCCDGRGRQVLARLSWFDVAFVRDATTIPASCHVSTAVVTLAHPCRPQEGALDVRSDAAHDGSCQNLLVRRPPSHGSGNRR